MRAIKTTTISILAVGLLAGSAVSVAAQDEEGDDGVVPSPAASASPPAPSVSPSAAPSAAPSMAPADGRVVELDLTSFQITQDGEQVEELDVAIGETITFRISNSSGLEHNFHIGTKLEMINNKVEGLPGVPVYTEGVREFTWIVPEDLEELRFGCTVSNHYLTMRGNFVVRQ